MNMKPKFNLTNEQKIEFGKLAIKAMHQQQSLIEQLDTKVFRVEPTTVVLSCEFKTSNVENQQDQTNLVFFRFKDDFLRCETNGIDLNINLNFTDNLQPLYFEYMYQTFGEPFRKAALDFWRERRQEEYNEFKERKAQLNQEGKELEAKHKKFLDTLSNLGKSDKKLSQFAAPQMKLNGADKTMNNTTKQTPCQDNSREM